jgi:hypothetical protein
VVLKCWTVLMMGGEVGWTMLNVGVGDGKGWNMGRLI